MIKTETVIVPTTTRTLETIKCDLCPCETLPGSREWDAGYMYEHNEVTIESTHNTHYPEGGSVEGVVFDCCPACFKTKVQPALEALGLVPRVKDVSF